MSIDGTTADCGTYAGAQRHGREGSPVCDDCKAARNEYAARHRALTRLAHNHRAEFHALFREEMKK